MPVVSNASCTTNCLAPICKVLEDNYGIEYGLMSTIHAATAKQKVVDSRSQKDWRTGRSAFGNLIPSTTGAAKAISLVIPALKDKMSGIFRFYRRFTCIDLDARQGIQVNSHFFKVICFYDNEWGYTSQIFRLIEHMDRIDHNR